MSDGEGESVKGFGDGFDWISWATMRDERDAVWIFSNGDGWGWGWIDWALAMEDGVWCWCWCWEEYGVWVWREERADEETEKEEREENWSTEIVEGEISGGKIVE